MGASTGVAPICNVNPPPQQFQTNPVYMPSVPPVVPTLASVAAAVNAIRTTLNTLNGGGGIGGGGNGGGNGNNGKPGGGGGRGSGGGGGGRIPSQPLPASDFKVIKQTVQQVKVYDPNDPSKQTFVVVNQVTGLSLRDSISKQGWSWTQPANIP
jgi:hypothetical protein